MRLTDYDINDRHQLKLIIRLTLTQPLSHISGMLGNQSIFMTQDVNDLEDISRPCPIITANSFRGRVLRREGCRGTLRDLANAAGWLWDGTLDNDTHHTVFCGGHIQKGGSTGNSMAIYDYVARNFPPLRLLGTAKPEGLFGEAKGMVMSGLLDVSNFWLVCYESLRCVPTQFFPSQVAQAYAQIIASEKQLMKMRSPNGMEDVMLTGSDSQQKAFLDYEERHKLLLTELIPRIRSASPSAGKSIGEQMFTHVDSHHDPKLAPYLKSANQLVLNGSTKPAKRSRKDDGEEKSAQMIVNDQLIKPGSQFVAQWRTRAPGITSIEEGFLVYALNEWRSNPSLGGKSARGAGGYPNMEVWATVDGRPIGKYLEFVGDAANLSERAAESQDRWQEYLNAYGQYMASNADAIAGFLAGGK